MASLIQRKKCGNWYALFSRPGKLSKTWKSTKTNNYQAAKEIVRGWEIEIAQGNAGIFKIAPVKFSDFCPKYLEWAQNNKRPGTLRRELGIIENHLKPFFGAMSLDWIQTDDIDRYISGRKKAGLTARNINLELILLTLMLKKAIEWKKLLRLPFTKRPKLKETDSKQRRALNQAEVSRLLDSASGHNRLFIASLAYTGARLSEVMYLHWDDIDLEQEQITIRPKPEAGFNTKSGKSRVIPMHSELKEMLEAVPEKSGWLFKDDSGKRITTLRWGWERACRKAGLEDISAHCLRHSFASLMIQHGVDAKTLSEILGHASPVITLQVYAHCFDQSRKQAIKKLPGFGAKAGRVIPFPLEKAE